MFNFVNAQTIPEAGGGGARAPDLDNSVDNETIKYDPEILEAFNNQTEVRVIVELKDNSNTTISGTKEERRVLSEQRDEWFSPKIDEVLVTLSEDEFRIIGSKTSVGFDGFITKEGFDKLVNDARISEVHLDRVGKITLDESENESEIITEVPEIKEEQKSLFWRFIQFIKSLFRF